MRTAPPLWVWLSCGFLLAVGLGAIQWFAVDRQLQLRRTQQYVIFKEQLKNFQLNYPKDSTTCRVLCLGSSLSSEAIERRDSMLDYLPQGSPRINIDKLYFLNANTKTFPYIDEVFRASEALHPQLICIEDHVFSHADRNVFQSPLLQELKYIFRHSTASPRLPRKCIGQDFDYIKTIYRTAPLQDTINYGTHRRLINSFEDNDALNQQLAFVLEQQIPLVVLNVPRAGPIEKIMITPQKQAQIDALIEDYQAAGFQIEYWKFPHYMPFKNYSDYAHMNARGRAIYSRWLSKRIAKYLSDKC